MAQRDTQRRREYAAEHELDQQFTRRFDTDTDIGAREAQMFLDWMLHDPWFRERWPRLVRGVNLKVSSNFKGGWSRWWDLRISGHPLSLTPKMMVHELAHLCTQEIHGCSIAGHGWEFCATYLELADHYLGADAAAALRRGYDQHNVKYTAPRTRKPLTDEQRTKAAANLVKARAARAAKPRFVWENTKRPGTRGQQGNRSFRDADLVTVEVRSSDPAAVGFFIQTYANRTTVTTARKAVRADVEALARQYPDVTFTATIAGSVHQWLGTGTVTETWTGHWSGSPSADEVAA